MGKYTLDSLYLGFGMTNQVVHNAECDLADNLEVILEKQIIVFVYAAGKRILQRHHTETRLTLFNGFKNRLERRHGYGGQLCSKILCAGLVTEGAHLS